MRYFAWTVSALVAIAGCADSGSEAANDEVVGDSTDESGSSSGESGESGDTTGSTTETTSTTSTDTETTAAEPFCGDGNVDPDEACDDANTNDFDGCLADCTLVELLDVPALEWTYVEVPGTRCMNGEVAGFGVNHNPDSPNVMIYLEGGGACFNDTCDFTAFSIPFVPPIDGIFSRDNNNNPVKDWTMIYVPYCTGDIHAGDAERELGGQIRQFRGYTNITTYLTQWVPSFPAERVLLTGISAGGFGAALNATQVADAYGDAVELTVVDDSGPPLSNDVIAPCLQTLFRETWNLDGTVLDACPQCDPTDFATDFLDYVIASYPNVRFGVFSNTSDAVISTYMGFGWGNGQWDNCEGTPVPVPALTYAEDLLSIRALHEEDISTFYVIGIGHTALRVGFNVTFAGGTSLPEWIGDVLDGQITHVGP